MLSRLIFVVLIPLTVSLCYGQKKTNVKQADFSVDSDTASDAEWSFPFININHGYYYDFKRLKEISQLESDEKTEELLPLLEDYVRHFGIPNFTRDIKMLWKLGQLYEVLHYKEKAAAVYRIVLKNHPESQHEVLQQFNNWDRYIEKNYYVPLDVYYELVDYRKKIDTLIPPRSINLNMG
jgi:hypothetical protein